MEDRLVRSSNQKQGVDDESTPFSLTEVFVKQCPRYMVMGMSYEDFWDGDVEKAKYVREAYRIKRDNDSFDMWLQGLYFYHAIIDASPTIRAFQKDITPLPYLEDPIALTDGAKETNRRNEERRKMERSKTAIMNMMANANRRMKEVNDGKCEH